VSILRSRLRRAGWGFSDQILSSLTNFALGIGVARSVSVEEFGAFSLVFGIFILLLGVARATSTEPLLVRGHESNEEWVQRVPNATGASLLIGVAAGIACIISGVVIRGALSGALVALGVSLPGLLLQDAWRYAFFSRRDGARAFANDLVWTLCLALSFSAVVFLDVRSGMAFILAWGISGTAGAIYGLIQTRLQPRPQRALVWWKDQRELTSNYLGEFTAMTGAGRITDFGIGAIAGLSAVGAIRGTRVLMGPLNVLLMSARLVTVPEAVRLSKSSPRRMKLACALVSLLLGTGALAWGLVLVMLPAELGRELLGPTWLNAREVVVPISLSMAGSGVLVGAGIGLRALMETKRAFRARIAVSLLTIANGLIGAGLGGAEGAAWGFAVAYAVGSVLWWSQLRAAVTEHKLTAKEALDLDTDKEVLPIDDVPLLATEDDRSGQGKRIEGS
jgi:O-antigen/teichoic acid export membrane protein